MSHLPADFHRRLEVKPRPDQWCEVCATMYAPLGAERLPRTGMKLYDPSVDADVWEYDNCLRRDCPGRPAEDPLGIVQNISRPAPLCACFPGACRGGEVIDGKLANGSLCQSCL